MATCYNWQSGYGGTEASDVNKPRDSLEDFVAIKYMVTRKAPENCREPLINVGEEAGTRRKPAQNAQCIHEHFMAVFNAVVF